MEDGRDNAPFIPPITAALLCTESGIPPSRQVLLATGGVSRVGRGGAGVMDLSAAVHLGLGLWGRTVTDSLAIDVDIKWNYYWNYRRQDYDIIAWVMAKSVMNDMSPWSCPMP